MGSCYSSLGKIPSLPNLSGIQERALDAVFLHRLGFKCDHWVAIYRTWTADRDLVENGLPQGIPCISHSTSPSLDELPWSLALKENNNWANSEHCFTVGCMDCEKLKKGIYSGLAWFNMRTVKNKISSAPGELCFPCGDPAEERVGSCLCTHLTGCLSGGERIYLLGGWGQHIKTHLGI